MPGIVGRGTTYNLPNYVGPLFGLTPTDTPFLSAIGGLSGGESASDTEFGWQTYDLRAAGQNVRTEGADAPAAEERVRANVSNVVQIHQESIDVSYTKLATTGSEKLDGQAATEAQWQILQMVKQIARDVEYSFIRGAYNKPADNTQARRTRGILEAIATNVVAATGELTEEIILDLMQQVWANGGIQEQETATLMAGAAQRRRLSKVFVTDKGYREETRNVGGVSVQTIETDFGRLNVMLNRHMPADQVAVVSLEQCKPRLLEVPAKGFLFVEPLAKVGASDRSQLYGEIGLEYGNERAHGKATGLTV